MDYAISFTIIFFFLTKSKIYLLGRKYNENKLKEQKFVKINKSIKIK